MAEQEVHIQKPKAMICLDEGFCDAACISTSLHEAFYDSLAGWLRPVSIRDTVAPNGPAKDKYRVRKRSRKQHLHTFRFTNDYIFADEILLLIALFHCVYTGYMI